MKFLLVAVNAKYIHSNPAIYSLRACAGEKLRQHVELAEYTINQPMQEILADIYVRKPDMIGFSCYIWNWRLVRELVGELPKLLPDAPIWLGGPEVSHDADKILQKHPQLAGIMVGEGEAVFRELLEYYAGRCAGNVSGHAHSPAGYVPGHPCPQYGEIPPVSGGSEKVSVGKGLQSISGLCLPTGYTALAGPVDMNTIPFLYHDLGPFENRILYYESSRGCPFRCSYCLSSLEKQVRLRDIDVVKKELQFFLDHRVRQVKFVDRTFNCNHAHAMAVWQYIFEHDNGVTNFHFEISADLLEPEEIGLLNRFRPGLAQLEIGVQSVNPATLGAIGRRTDLEKLERAVAAVRREGNVHQHLDLIAGLPYEDYESFSRSFNRVYRMRPEQLQLGFLKVLKGSGMWEKAGEYGICYGEEPPYEVLYTRWLSYEEMLRLKRVEEMVEIYYNSAQFTHTIPFLEKAFPDPFSLYEALADFYRERGYSASSHSRVERYHILLAFVIEYDAERLDVYRELLTFDLYLRENMKSRPEFASDQSQYKEHVRAFYKEEEKTRRYLPGYEAFDWKQLMKMTHLEGFACPVWDRERMAAFYDDWKADQGPYFALFDYRRRNPLNYEAFVQHIVAFTF